ncbi:lipoprotein lipase [Callorhinchus milii]|uniref:triacylglycerol lipase n=1 Tax=Callorhinchus milii TaxID=7868 RepID=A0A4W3KDN5_CALMI|nr:lipoprotein lipase [Callorhinchus milii]|eukprot:gi/632966060/ref/XP_007899210.1/ PREDICTED: lipoprotein lipase-like [Callorhinchus milii]
MRLCLCAKSILLFLSLSLLPASAHEANTNTNTTDTVPRTQGNSIEDLTSVRTRFSLRVPSQPDEDVCHVIPGRAESLAECGFNATSKSFLIIHGWSVSGMFESWIHKLVTALYQREPAANVLVVDWLNRAHQHYPIAAQNTVLVGEDIAKFLNWIKELVNVTLDNVHLIGYSLGAHVAGFAGSHVANKIGRITGLDPAGPVFEGVHAHSRLSPDDAAFVDVLHTFTRESLGMSIGIRQPIGHVDIYPNGGSFQPGCDLQKAVNNIATYGIYAFSEAVKCEHERSIHLFIDSLLYMDQPCTAYRCSSHSAFEKGMCLNCRKNRCNTLGYNANPVRSVRHNRMYLKTRADMPFRVYHYQLKIHFSSKINHSDINPRLSVSLYGTKDEVENLHIDIKEKFAPNKTHSFLVVTETDIGDLLLIKFKWETSSSWDSLWEQVKNSISWAKLPFWTSSVVSSSDIHVRRIRVKSGEMQKKMVFCLKDVSAAIIQSQEVIFIKCPPKVEQVLRAPNQTIAGHY